MLEVKLTILKVQLSRFFYELFCLLSKAPNLDSYQDENDVFNDYENPDVYLLVYDSYCVAPNFEGGIHSSQIIHSFD